MVWTSGQSFPVEDFVEYPLATHTRTHDTATVSMETGKMSTWCHLTRSGLRLLCQQRFAYSLPFQVHISFTPRVFSSSLNKHPLIKSAGVDSVLHSDIQQGFWRNFSTCSAVQETHLHQRQGELFSCSTTESPHVKESKTVLDSGF